MKRSQSSADADDLIVKKLFGDRDRDNENHHVLPPPLDVLTFPVSWPKWRRQFQIYMSATYDDRTLTDRKRLAIFLNCLGKDGIDVAASFYPHLNDFDSAEAKNVTFDMVWSSFNSHCSSSSNSYLESYKFFKTAINDDLAIEDLYFKLLSAADKCDFKCRECHTSYSDRIVRDRLVAAVSDENIAKELLTLWNPSPSLIIKTHQRISRVQKIWMDILNYLCLCAMDSLAQMSSRIRNIVDNHVNTGPYGLQIQQCCLDRHPIRTDKEFYQKYKTRNSFLKIKSISESDADQVLRIFSGISRLALYEMQIFEDLPAFPTTLEKLTVTDSVIEQQFLQKFLDNNKSTLQLLSMENVEHSFRGLGVPLVIDHVDNLSRLIILGDSLNLLVGPHLSKLSFIHIQADRLIGRVVVGNNVLNLILDVPNSPQAEISCGDSPALKSLTIYDWPPPFTTIPYPHLENLLILTPVDVKYKNDIVNSNIQNVLFTCDDPSEEEQIEPNLIFEMLNDDYILLEITNYLPVSDWINFGLIHPRSDWIVINCKYPRANLTMQDLPKLNIARIAKLIGKLSIQTVWPNGLSKFSHLRSLTLDNIQITKERVRSLPDGLVKLNLSTTYEEGLELTPYFKRLSSTLRVLEVDKLPNDDAQCLIKLRGLREIRIGKPSSDHTLFFDRIAKIVKLNPGLERVDLYMGSLVNDFWNAIGALKNLSNLVISLDKAKVDCPKFAARICALLMAVGPQLKVLKVNKIHSNEFIPYEYLNNLEEVSLYIFTDFKNTICEISLLKSLIKLRIDHKYSNNDRKPTAIANAVILLVKSLPNLSEIHWPYLEPFPIKLGLKLQQYLRKSNRALRINSVDV